MTISGIQTAATFLKSSMGGFASACLGSGRASSRWVWASNKFALLFIFRIWKATTRNSTNVLRLKIVGKKESETQKWIRIRSRNLDSSSPSSWLSSCRQVRNPNFFVPCVSYKDRLISVSDQAITSFLQSLKISSYLQGIVLYNKSNSTDNIISWALEASFGKWAKCRSTNWFSWDKGGRPGCWKKEFFVKFQDKNGFNKTGN